MSENISPKILEQVRKLEEKYEAMGQDLSSYLDGLLHADYLTYWDYIHLDTLLSLQNPKTQFPDEQVFIIYHQITELYFKLILHEIYQTTEDPVDEKTFLKRLNRINRYFEHLVDSFNVMTDGMDQHQFLSFRMSLLPASGFQSGQYRMIEILCTDMINLTKYPEGQSIVDNDIEAHYDKIYWKMGATELATGKKTLTLRQFEEKYSEEFVKLGKKHRNNNIWKLYQAHYQTSDSGKIREAMRLLDALANVFWPLAHYKSAVRYLQRDPEDIAASGGTNWQKYLPPRFQRVIFYPSLWSEREISEWGKGWVMKEIFGQ